MTKMTKTPETNTVKDLIKYLETLPEDMEVYVVEEVDNYPLLKPLVIDINEVLQEGNTDTYYPTLTTKPSELILGWTSYGKYK